MNVAIAIRRDDLLLLDAEEALATIMRGELPASPRHHGNFAAVVKQLLRGLPVICACSLGDFLETVTRVDPWACGTKVAAKSGEEPQWVGEFHFLRI